MCSQVPHPPDVQLYLTGCPARPATILRGMPLLAAVTAPFGKR
eukprot:CAMPEP_0205922136 /NCGR_PEP_ID=MMETSP1325-20131115/13992_1 /ASSEMBLY_ACC=CAM_ASM_000708 /TAXON_ID=236786 /ORGANISM="Florenciella sp., Strain RCC1007" /LENGTH=42 /DNA_ID= /DNA_START= /DNA_END= /DNA_ORIENTATION=